MHSRQAPHEAAPCRRKFRAKNKMNTNKPPFKAVFSCPEDCEKRINGYFDEYLPNHEGEVADIEALADYLRITRRDVFDMLADRKYAPAAARAMNRIAKIKKQLAFSGKIPPAVFSFDMKNNHEYKDRPESDAPAQSTVVFRGETYKWAD